MKSVVQAIIICLFIFTCGALADPCSPKSYGYGSFVCVCNSTYCDTFESVLPPEKGQAALYESAKLGKRFVRTNLTFVSTMKSNVPVITVVKKNAYQKILGFGGAFTDAAGINIASLSRNQQKDILSSYFSESGLEYSMGRVPMASCDFSVHKYSYDDVKGDFNLNNFKLAEEDLKYKIPYIKMAQQLSQQPLLLFGSPWSAPAWMKTSGRMEGPGTLIGKPGGPYYQTWANYFVRFLQEYKKQNIPFWGLTVQNEPLSGYIPNYPFQTMGFTAQLQRDFIKLDLGPTLAKNGFGVENIKLMILDDNRFMLPKYADVILADTLAAQYISGVAFHWYFNTVAPAVLLDITRNKHPDIFYLPTEACTGSFPWDVPKVKLGSWERGEKYAHDIIQDLLHWSAGWIDWNLALDLKGGPNWVKNFVDAPIIVNNKTKEFYKQPMYYVLAHFSKFLPRKSVRIDANVKGYKPKQFERQLDVVGFQTPTNRTVVIILNRNSREVPLVLQDTDLGYLDITVSPHSIQSYIW